jgi:iron complex outermembrane recepter protein
MFNAKKFSIGLLTICAACSMSAHETLAEDEDSASLTDISTVDEVVVLGAPITSYAEAGTKTPTPLIETSMAITSFNRERLEAQNIANVADILKYVAGAQDSTNNWEHSDGYNLRGFDQSSYILWDGLLRNDPGWWSASEPFTLERLEIIKGPASVLYGQTAPGGMVAMTSKRPDKNAKNTAEVVFGSFDSKGVNLDVGGSLNTSGTFVGRLIGTHLSEADQVDTLGFRRTLVQPSLTWQITDDSELTLIGLHQVDVDDYNSSVSAYGTLLPNPNGKFKFSTYLGEPDLSDSYEIAQNSIGYAFTHRFNDTWSFTQNARRFKVDVKGTDVISANSLQDDLRTANRDISDYVQDVRNWQIDNMLLGQLKTDRIEHTFLAGIDYGTYEWGYSGNGALFSPIDIFTPVYGNHETSEFYEWTFKSQPRQTAFYVQQQAKIDGKFIVMAGLRYDKANNTDNDGTPEGIFRSDDKSTTGRLGFLYLTDNGFSPYLSYATSFLPTTGIDRLGRSFVPETGKQHELGLKYGEADDALQATLAIFDITRNNMLTRDPEDENFRVQNGSQQHRGIELETQTKLSDNLALNVTYSRLHAEITESFDPGLKGNRPETVPKTSASVWADYRIQAIAGLSLNLGMTYFGNSFGDPENTLAEPRYTLVDTGIHYQRDVWQFSLSITNLTDKSFVASCYSVDFCSPHEPRLISGKIAVSW